MSSDDAPDDGSNPVGNPDNVEDTVKRSDPSELNVERADDTGGFLHETWRNFADQYIHGGIRPKPVTPELFESIQDAVSDGGGRLLRVDPYPENESVAASDNLLKELHDARLKWFNLVNASETHGFEIWFNDGKISFYFYVRSERAEKKFKKLIDAYYPNAKVEPIHGSPRRALPNENPDEDNEPESEVARKATSWWDERFVPIYDGDYVAATELKKKLSFIYPTRSSQGVESLDEDPYKAITSELTSADYDRTIIQVVFRPTGPDWSNGKFGASFLPTRTSANELSTHMQDQKLKNQITGDLRPPSQEEQRLAEIIQQNSRRKAYHANIRIVSFSPYRSEARQNVWSLATTFESAYEEAAGENTVQSFSMIPAAGRKINKLVKRAARREWIDRDTILTVPELSAVAHVPNESIETPAVTWNQTGKGARPPADMPRFDEPPERLPPGVRRSDLKEDERDGEALEEPSEEEPVQNDKEPVRESDTSREQPATTDSSGEDMHSHDTDRDDPDSASTEPTDTEPVADEDEDDSSDPDESGMGIIESSFSDDDSLTDDESMANAFGSNNNDEDDTSSDEVTGDDTETTPNEHNTPTTSSTDRDDPDEPSTNNAGGISSGFNKDIGFGDNPVEDDTNDEDEAEEAN